jgi:Pyridoxamine 5'-phosphate oxidase
MSAAPLRLPQGDLRLLETPAATALLARAIPARAAYVTRDGAPRIVPTWFHWDGEELVMPTWSAGPHIRHPARRLRSLRERPNVAVSIDTEDQPPVVLQIRGRATIDEVTGVVPEYRLAAERYLGAEAAAGFLAEFDGVEVTMARVAVRPEWVGLIDFSERLPGPLGGVLAAEDENTG